MGLIIFSVVVIVIGIIKVHELPGNIALCRGHPQADAIRICSLLGLIIFPFWMFAMLSSAYYAVLRYSPRACLIICITRSAGKLLNRVKC